MQSISLRKIIEYHELFFCSTEWFVAANEIICFVTNSYLKHPKAKVFHLGSTVKYRVSTVAENTGALILSLLSSGIISSLQCITMIGFSLGAHIASFTCRYLYKQTMDKQKVSFLLGKLVNDLLLN